MSGPCISIDCDRFVRLTGLSPEAAYALLSSRRTRIVLHALSTCEPPLSLDRLVTTMTRLDAGRSRSSARISLVHAGLPKLEDYGVLEYELRSETVRLEGPVVGLEEPLGTVSIRDEGGSAGRRDASR